MTEPLVKLPSVIEDELHAEIADLKAQIAGQKKLLASQEVENQRLLKLISHLSAVILVSEELAESMLRRQLWEMDFQLAEGTWR